jgi:hypothetical protein
MIICGVLKVSWKQVLEIPLSEGEPGNAPFRLSIFFLMVLPGFQIDCGLRIQGGNYVRGRYNPNGGLPFSKYSYRLYFRGDYGESALTYPLIPDLLRMSISKLFCALE